MENRSSRPAEFLVVFVLFICAILASVVAVGHDRDGSNHQSILEALRQLHFDQASLQRDILQARAGLLQNFDPLVASVVRIHGGIANLRVLIDQAEMGSVIELHGRIAALDEMASSEEKSVEEFKTRNALFENSYRLFGHLLGMVDNVKMHGGSVPVEGTGTLMLRFLQDQSPEIATLLKIKFALLVRSGGKNERALARHGQMILMSRPAANAALDAVQKSPVPRLISAIERTYMEAFIRMDRSANRAKVALAGLAILLCGLVAVLLNRLRTHSGQLAERLAFESTANLVKTHLSTTASDMFAPGIESALADIARHFDADSAGLLTAGFDGAKEEWFTLKNYDAHRLQRISHEMRDIISASKSPFTIIVDDDCGGEVAVGMAVAGPSSHRMIVVMTLWYKESMPQITPQRSKLLEAMLQVVSDSIILQRSRAERDTLMQRLEHGKRLEAVGTLAGGVAHEFNNSLGAILGYGELLVRSLRRHSKPAKYVREIIDTCQNAMSIVEQILSYSRTRERENRSFDLGELASNSVVKLRVSLPDSDIAYNESSQVLAIRGNPTEAHQILTNLCKNAVEASAASRCLVSLSACEVEGTLLLSHGELAPGRYASLVVADDGPGIPRHLVDRIFEPFFTTKSHRGGTGLGLATVYGCLTSLEGQMNLRTGPHGTRFELYFPVSNTEPIPLEAFFGGDSVVRGRGEMLLVIATGDEERLACEDHAAAFGYEPRGFRTTEEALRWLESNEAPALIISKYGICSEGASERLKKVAPHTPWLLIVERESLVGPIEGEILYRPYNAKAFSEAVRRSLGTPQA
ncbi:hypothetical protein HFO58_34965 [Rhizobium leguminosarum]|uniref:DAHL domain-containing protein n=1 Tax=Rhizobium leguminosarum TaxID=384 RepID=UPI001C955791|nr:DAHL domain-containing protein [Rhizobium leguminosarum]MBY5538276.1 hypothetical protein [Rhizobium leguminosarum]